MFNLKRFSYFLKLNFYLQRKLILWLALAFALLFVISANVGPASSAFFNGALFIGGAVLTSQAFADIHDSNFAIQALTLPVSSTERYLALWLLTGPFYLFALLALYSLAILVHVLNHSFWGFWQDGSWSLGYIALQYLIFNALFLLGAVVFKRLVLLKTIACLFALFLISVTLQDWMNGVWNSLIYWGILAIISWCLGYYRLKQIQLK